MLNYYPVPTYLLSLLNMLLGSFSALKIIVSGWSFYLFYFRFVETTKRELVLTLEETESLKESRNAEIIQRIDVENKLQSANEELEFKERLHKEVSKNFPTWSKVKNFRLGCFSIAFVAACVILFVYFWKIRTLLQLKR